MIINENRCGIYFEEDEATWELNGNKVPYEEVVKAISESKKIDEICIGSDDDYCEFETDEMTWELNWRIRIANYNGKFYLTSYIDATPYEYFDYLTEKENDEEDYEEVAQKMMADLAKDSHVVSANDICIEPEGDYLCGIKQEFDTIEEAFAGISAAIDSIYNYLNVKGRFVRLLAEHYEENE